jgi:hypothetical protein
MSRHFLVILSRVLGLVLLSVVVPAMAATPPSLYTINSGTPKVLGQGVQKSWPIKVSENNAFDAVFKGGMWLPNPNGGRIYVKYQRHIIHPNGTWTWIGTVSTVHGDRSVILTFGKDGVFGLVPQASGYPLRIVTQHGQTNVIETSAEGMARAAEALRLYSRPDYIVPPGAAPQGNSAKAAPRSAVSAAVQPAAAGPTVIDVMVAYTPGFVNETGSQSAALTRIQNLVDIANQAYATSGVNQQIRLVNTVQVNYPDNTANQNALDDITGIDENGNPVTIPSSLQGIAALRTQYGADLVTLIRSFDDATQQGCGVGWLIGGNETTIVPSQAKVYGYNVVSDGMSVSGDKTYYCLDTTFAHELGHNMGDAHDRANASEPGAYSYSYGYLGNGTNGFSTIMAYGTDTTTPLAVFSNPNISICQGTPCGVADSSSSSADNVHSMNNTAPLIAQFEPTMVGNPPIGSYQHNDVNGDGKSDIVFTNPVTGSLVYWIMNGSRFVSFAGFYAGPAYRLMGTGDLNGDDQADMLWTDGVSVWAWLSNGSGGFTGPKIGALPSGSGWTLVGCTDVNRDGKQDIIWYNPNTQTLLDWVMNGSAIASTNQVAILPGLKPVGVGDFNGDGFGDIALVGNSGGVQQLYIWIGNGSYFTQYQSNVSIASSWQFAGAGDVNGDGKSDVFWYLPQTGTLWYWLMKGATVFANKQTTAGPSFKVVAIGDFDGDSYSDVLWQSSDNVIWMWLHTNPYSYGGYKVLPQPAGWNIIP